MKYTVALILFFLCTSCDILRISPFEVSEWSPGLGYHADPETLSVYVSFSHEPDRESAERYFSFIGNGEIIRGVFQWEGKKMLFLPHTPLEVNKDYSIRITSNARDTTGLSMDREFEGFFTTRADNNRPCIVSFYPAAEGVMDHSIGTCVIRFSDPVSLKYVREAASFSPSIAGAWHLEEGGIVAVFTPLESWPQGRRFELRLSSSLKGINGMEMRNDFNNIFYIGEDRSVPYLVGAWRLTANGEREEIFHEPLGEFIENDGWEKNDKLVLGFSRPVDLLSVNTALSAEGVSAPVLEMQSDDSHTGFASEAVFRFDRTPAYESRFSVRLRSGIKDRSGNEAKDEYVFRIFANGENSKPPSLVGIRLPMSPEDDSDFQLRTYSTDQLFDDFPVQSENYPYNVKTAAWIEFYFDCSAGATIDPFSLMEFFRIETSNNVIQFVPLAVRTNGFSVDDPHPLWEGYQRIEIAGDLTNTANSGLVHFFINRGIRDSSGNTSENQFRISVIK